MPETYTLSPQTHRTWQTHFICFLLRFNPIVLSCGIVTMDECLRAQRSSSHRIGMTKKSREKRRRKYKTLKQTLPVNHAIWILTILGENGWKECLLISEVGLITFAKFNGNSMPLTLYQTVVVSFIFNVSNALPCLVFGL